MFDNPTQQDILEIIIDNPKRTRGGIYEQLQNKGKAISKRSINRNLQAMCKKGILTQYKSEFTITNSFARHFTDLHLKVLQATMSSYQFNHKIMYELHQTDLVTMDFRSGFEYENAMAELCYVPFENTIEHEYSFTFHYPYLLTPQGEEFLKFTEMSSYRLSIALAGNTNIDQAVAEKLRQYNHNVEIIGDSCLEGKNIEYCLWGKDNIMFVSYSDEYLEKETKLLNECKDGVLSNDFMEFFTGKSDKNWKISVTMIRDAEKAQALKSKLKALMAA